MLSWKVGGADLPKFPKAPVPKTPQSRKAVTNQGSSTLRLYSTCTTL